jgi:predicted NBD/HSP70 family sugar kinase
MNSGSLMHLVAAGDSRAVQLADRYAHNIAVGIANVQQTLAPNQYILHGDVVLGGTPLIDAIAKHVRRLVPGRPGLTIEISAGGPGDRAALLGAAGLVLSDLLQLSV